MSTTAALVLASLALSPAPAAVKLDCRDRTHAVLKAITQRLCPGGMSGMRLIFQINRLAPEAA